MAASNSSPGPFLYVFIFIALAVGGVLLVSDYSGPGSVPGQVGADDSLFESVAGPDDEIPDVQQCIEGYRQLVAAGRYYEDSPSSYVLAELRSMGLGNPVSDLRADLKGHPELIPHKGTLGGTMGFHFPDRIHVLSSQWVLAYFEDGHFGGHVLLKFAVTDKGLISWTTVDSFLD